MKLKFLVLSCMSILLMSSAMAEDQIINEEEFSDFSALDLAQNDIQSIEGTSASGETQTTIVDEGGNLKIVEKPKTETSSQAKNEVDQSKTSPGMTQSAPTGKGPTPQPPVQTQVTPPPTPSTPNQPSGMTPPKPANPGPQGQGMNQPPTPNGTSSELPTSAPQQMQMPEPQSTDMPNS